jgi:phenylpropionate dioxygenase-like ring-hydroxylating dioxygenase large terminal subunit
VRSGTSDVSLPEGEVPVAVYTDPERLAAERDVLFRRLPLMVGFSSQVRSPGDWFAHDHTGVPILVVRGEDGGLRAFLNVCRHRGARLVKGDSGHAEAPFSCWFHGWTYALDGQLIKVPELTRLDSLDRARSGLVPLTCAERYGFVFVVPTPGEGCDIDAWLGPLLADLGTFGIGDWVMTSPVTQTRKLNWKLHMDATQEIVHLPYLHANTAGSGYFTNCSILEHVAPHARVIMPGDTVRELRDAERSTWRITDHCAIVYALFPNTTMLLHYGYLQLLSVFPVDADTTIMHGAMLVPAGEVDYAEVYRRKFHHDGYWATMAEDMAVCEQMQANMRTGANGVLRFARAEGLLPAFHRTVAAMLAQHARPPLH